MDYHEGKWRERHELPLKNKSSHLFTVCDDKYCYKGKMIAKTEFQKDPRVLISRDPERDNKMKNENL